MFRILEIAAEGDQPPEVDEGLERVGRAPPGTLRWIDLAEQDEASLAVLKERFDFHPLALEDCLHFDQRPKLEEYGDYLFIVVHGFARGAAHTPGAEPLELHAFLGKGWLVTVHASPVPELEQVWKRVAADPGLGRRGADFLYYLLVDAVVDANFLILDDVSDLLDHIEEAVLVQHERQHLSDIFALKKSLVTLRRVLSPQRDVFALLAKRGHPCVTDRTAFYFRDVYDHLVRISEAIDQSRDLLGNTLDAHLSMVAQRTNDIMKRLTLLSAVFLPLTFVTGFFGQNFTTLPFGNHALMVAMLAACVVIPAGMVVWFVRSHYF